MKQSGSTQSNAMMIFNPEQLLNYWCRTCTSRSSCTAREDLEQTHITGKLPDSFSFEKSAWICTRYGRDWSIETGAEQARQTKMEV